MTKANENHISLSFIYITFQQITQLLYNFTQGVSRILEIPCLPTEIRYIKRHERD